MKHLPTKSDIREMIEESMRPAWRIGIVYSTFYTQEMETMVEGAKSTLRDIGIESSNISEHPVPGSFEIPLIARNLASKKTVDAVIALGLIVQGQTHHARLVAEQSVRGIMDVQLQFGIPCICEVIFADTMETIRQRLHKGEEAAYSAIYCLAQLQKLQS